MSKSTAVATLPKLSQIGSVALPAKVVAELTKTGDYLERLQLYQGSSGAVKKQVIGVGRFGIPKTKDSIDDLGNKIDITVLGVRAKALNTKSDPIIESYDVESETFKQIETTAKAVPQSGCMSGLEYLVFERSSGKFLTYFAYSGSAKQIATDLLPNENLDPITLTSRFVEKKDNSWHAPEVLKCSVPFTNLPSVEEIIAVVEKFNNPKPSQGGGTEVSATEAKAVAGRRR